MKSAPKETSSSQFPESAGLLALTRSKTKIEEGDEVVRAEEGGGERKREGGKAHAYQQSSKTEFLHEGSHSERSEIGKMEPKVHNFSERKREGS